MAIQIWDPVTNTYKSADLSRFGPSGTLTEALVWDGTQYVKVWPTTPESIYPVSGEWGPLVPTATATVYGSHTIAEAGNYTLTHTKVGGGSFMRIRVVGPWGTTSSVAGQNAVTTDRELSAGDLIEFGGFSTFQPESATGFWSIVKN